MGQKAGKTRPECIEGKRQLRILITCPKDPLNPYAGGGVKVTWWLARALLKNDFKVTWLTAIWGKMPRRAHYHGIKIIRLCPIPLFYIMAPLYLFYARITGKYDFVVESMLFTLPLFPHLFYGSSRVVALIFHLIREVFIVEARERVGALGTILGYLMMIFEDKICPRIYRPVIKITFSYPTYYEMKELGFGNNIVVLHEGINLRKYRPDLNNKFKEPTFIYVGRLVKYKGVQDLLRAFKIVVKKYPKARLYIVGRGPFMSALKKLADELSITDNVIFTGFISEEEKIKLLQRAHVLVMPSWQEGWATPVIEANACGTPAIASDAKGVKETISEGVNGLIFRCRDYKELAEKMMKIDELIKLSRSAYEFAKKYDWNWQETRFLRIIEKLIGIKRRGDGYVSLEGR